MDSTADAKRTMPTWKKWLIRVIFWGVIIGAIVAWPQGVGAVLAGGAILLLVLVLWIKYKIKKFLAPLQDLELFPESIKLTLQEKVSWNKADLVAAASEAIKASGFEPIGTFTINKSTNQFVEAFMNEKESAYAVVYDFPFTDVVVDYVSEFEDGSCFTCSNTQLPEILEYPSGRTVDRHPGMDAGPLYEEFVSARPDGPRMPVSADGFVARFEQYHAEVMAWNREQVDYREKLAQALHEEFLAQSNWSAIEWDRKQNRVVFVHDALPSREVVDMYVSALCLEDEGEFDREKKRAEALVKEATKTDAFERMIQESPHQVGLEKLMELTTPVRANVYLSAAEEE